MTRLPSGMPPPRAALSTSGAPCRADTEQGGSLADPVGLHERTLPANAARVPEFWRKYHGIAYKVRTCSVKRAQ